MANFFSSTTLNNTASINNSSYIEFSATAAAGYRLNLAKLSFLRSGSGTCPNQLEVHYSTDGFATSTSMSNSALTTTTATTLTWDFADFNTPVSGTITFRLYPYGTQRADLGVGAAASTGTFRIDDLTIYGSVVLPPPTITTTTRKTIKHNKIKNKKKTKPTKPSSTNNNNNDHNNQIDAQTENQTTKVKERQREWLKENG